MPHDRRTDRTVPDLRRFATRALDRRQLPPLPLPAGTVRRRHVAGGADRSAIDLTRARQDTLRCLHAWCLTPRAVDAVRLVASELMTHALRHELAGRLDLELVDQRDHVTVVVEFHRAAAVDADIVASPFAPGQIGLVVVERLAERWGRITVETSGRLWAEIAAPRTPAAD